ncbi:MAG: M23 family metallopeptidase [Bacteroidota bacterium]
MIPSFNRATFFLAATLFTLVQSHHSIAQTLHPKNLQSPEKPFSFPLQLKMSVPFNPTAFANGSKHHLIYELYLTNFSSDTIKLRRIQLIDPNTKDAQPVITFDATQLYTMLQPLGKMASDKLTLASGQAAIVFIEADAKKSFPGKLLHRVVTETDSLEGAVISTRQSKLQVLTSPLEGPNWTAVDGPGNDVDNHHRRGTIILDGRSINSRRYAIDWKKFRDIASFSGDSKDVHSYFCYGEPVFAVADGRVIRAKDGLPNNIPGHGAAFHPAVVLTFEKLAGNTVVIDLGNGHYAHYMHLQPGSLRIKAGDRVHKGQLIARIGASGDAREPHLHFEVTTSPHLLFGEGIPYLIDRYKMSSQTNHATGIRINEMPTDGEVVDFEKKSVKK